MSESPSLEERVRLLELAVARLEAAQRVTAKHFRGEVKTLADAVGRLALKTKRQ